MDIVLLTDNAGLTEHRTLRTTVFGVGATCKPTVGLPNLRDRRVIPSIQRVLVLLQTLAIRWANASTSTKWERYVELPTERVIFPTPVRQVTISVPRMPSGLPLSFVIGLLERVK